MLKNTAASEGMKGCDRRLRLAVSATAALFLLILYIVIFCFSGQDGETSGNFSRMISEKCVEFFNTLTGRSWTEVFMDGLAAYFEHPIRKLAHFAEYALMGILLYVMWRPWKKRSRRLYLFLILWVLVSAAGDELHQLFVAGRYASPADVLLDTCGGAFGVLLLAAFDKCRENWRLCGRLRSL